MLAMQYTIQLPDGYQPALVQKRVEERHPLFVGRQGLVHKSYLYDEADNIYAPFYIWQDSPALADFLVDDLFSGVVQSFSRPRVRSWHVLKHYTNPQPVGRACVARREMEPIPSEVALRPWLEREWAEQTALRVHDALCYHVIALDPDRWECIRYSEWTSAAEVPSTSSDCYQDYTIIDRWRKE